MSPATDDDETRVSVRATGVTWRETGDEIVVLDLEGSVYFGLNGSGAALWRRMTSPTSRSHLVAQLRSQGADDQRAGPDVDAFLSQLEQHGLLSRAGATEG